MAFPSLHSYLLMNDCFGAKAGYRTGERKIAIEARLAVAPEKQVGELLRGLFFRSRLFFRLFFVFVIVIATH
jgi:hypothetical protein